MRAFFVSALAIPLALALPAKAQEEPFGSPFDEHSLDIEPLPPLPEARDVPPLPEDGATARDEAAAPMPPPPEPPTLDSLFADLKRQSAPERAERIAAQIQARWLDSGSATVDLLLQWAGRAVRDGNHGAAFDLYEQAMVLAPGYAGAWNARATLNFQLERYGRSIADIEQTLAREPRHFGALAGLAAILDQLDRSEEALVAYRRVLDIYPAMRPAQDAVARLSAQARGHNL